MIELKPVLNKKDLENISLYQKMPYRQFYNDNDEGKIYDVVKSIRKQNSYWPSKIDDKKPETYSNLIINKPKANAPASTASKLLWIINWVYEDWTKIAKKVWEKKDEAISKVWDALVPDIVSTGYQFIKPQLKAVTDYALPTALGVPEELKSNYKWTKALQPLTTTAFEVVSAVSQPLENIGKASYLKVKDNASLPYDIVKWTIDWKWVRQIFKDREERQFYDRLFLWVNWFDDILTISTSNERRMEMINQLSNPADKEKAEKYLEDNKWQIMWTDILYWVWAWIIWWGWIRWAASAIKNKWVRDILNVTANVIDPSLNDLAKVWVVLWALSWIQYTINWSFWIEWETAEEGAFIALLATALKWMWVAIPATYKGVKELLSTDEVKDWMDMFFWKYKQLNWVSNLKADILNWNEYWDITHKIRRLNQSDVEELFNDADVLNRFKELQSKYPVNFKWINKDYYNWIIKNAESRIEKAEQLIPEYQSILKTLSDIEKWIDVSQDDLWIMRRWIKDINEYFPWIAKFNKETNQLEVSSEDLSKWINLYNKYLSWQEKAIEDNISKTYNEYILGSSKGQFDYANNTMRLFYSWKQDWVIMHEFSHNLNKYISSKEQEKVNSIYLKSFKSRVNEIYNQLDWVTTTEISNALRWYKIDIPNNASKELREWIETKNAKISKLINQNDYRYRNEGEFFAEELKDALINWTKKTWFLEKIVNYIKQLFDWRKRFFNNLSNEFVKWKTRSENNAYWWISDYNKNSQIKEDDINYAVNSIPERWFFKAWEKNIQRKLIDTWYTYDKNKSTISNWLNIRTKQLEQRVFQRREIEAVKMFWWNEADIANLEQLRIRWSEENLVKAFNKKAKSLSENALNKYWEYAQLKSRYMQMVNRNTDTLAKLEELWNEKAWIEAAIDVARRAKNPSEDNFKEIFNLENKLAKLNKEIEKVTAANKLDTKVNIWWRDIVFRTTDEIDAYLKWVESKYNSVAEMSDLQASLQKTVLNWLYDSWVISAKQYDALMRNPYYVPAKLTEESKKGDIGEQMYEMRAGLIKWLWEWSDELTFSLDGIDNLINYYRRAYSIMTKNDFLREFDEIATRWWQDLINLKNKEWFTSVPMFKDWERFDIFLPNFVTKRFEVDDVSQNLFLKTLRKWNQLSKVLITSYEPLFVAKMLLSEHLSALMQSANTWTVSWEFFNFLPKKAATKVWEILKSDIWDRDFYNAMSQYIDATWASYWWMKGTSKDMLNELSSDLYYSKNAYLRWYINTIDWVWKVFSDVEKYSTRWPVFTSALYKNAQDVWMDKAEFRTLVKSFLNKETWLLDDRWLTKALKEKWINANLAAKYSRGIFDYLSAWDDFVFLWRYIAYANLVPVTGKALYNFSAWAIKRLWSLPTKQKNRAIAWITATIWAVQSMAFVNYAYNYWLFKFPNESDEWFEERKRLWELLRTQPDYTKFRPWRAYLWTDWKIHHSNIGILNNTLYDFVYRATYTAMELARWNWMDLDWVLKQADDLTYFTKARWGVLESINLFTPTTLKWALESSFNKSLYHWGQIYTPWLWLNDDKNVWVIANTIWDILSFWYSEWPLWEKVWGFQVNKKMLDNVIKFWDPEKNWFIKTLINNAQSEIINSSVNWITPKETNYIFRLFWSSAKIMDETINWLYNASNDVSSNYKIQQNLVKNTFSETKSKEEAIDTYAKLAKNARASYWKDHKLVKYIEWELLNRIKALEWNWIVKNLNALQANAIWKRMAELSNEWNTSEIKNIEKWMIEAWFTTYKTKQVIIARKLYSAKTEEELKTISVNLLKTFKSDDAKTNDYIRRTILEVRDLLNAK